MNEPIVAVELADGAISPEYKTEESAGADISARLDAPVIIDPGCRALVPTGIRMRLPEGYEAQVRSRSGLAAKYGVCCLNSPGTIDSDYRGEVMVILQNQGSEPYTVSDGDRIAQLVVAPVCRAKFTLSESLPDSARGSGGFGSTGR